ncbi:hypothetical protein HDU76_012489 [Blyttiomyces sp. JEL0837]|nr:hypothetical protein HDU76_012489 [Blyttiomyces sp. JEL0837]
MGKGPFVMFPDVVDPNSAAMVAGETISVALFSFAGIPYILAYLLKVSRASALPLAAGASSYHLGLTIWAINSMITKKPFLVWSVNDSHEQKMMKAAMAVAIHGPLFGSFVWWYLKGGKTVEGGKKKDN